MKKTRDNLHFVPYPGNILLPGYALCHTLIEQTDGSFNPSLITQVIVRPNSNEENKWQFKLFITH
jgi:hypothetical protein